MIKTLSTLLFALCFSTTMAGNAAPQLVAYWQNFSNGATAVKLSNIPTNYNTLVIAFAELARDGTVSFNLESTVYNSLNEFKQDIATVQARGTKVMLSLGGQLAYFNINDSAAKDTFVNSLVSVVQALGVDGVDYDFESGLSNSNAQNYLLPATKEIKSLFSEQGKKLLISIAPETFDTYFTIFPNGKYDPLIIAGVVDTVQVQLYNSGCMGGINGTACYSQGTIDFTVSQIDSILQTWKNHAVPMDETQLLAGYPATASAASGGYIDPALINQAFSCLKNATACGTYQPTTPYPNLGGAMAWSADWDASNYFNFATTLSACVLQGTCD